MNSCIKSMATQAEHDASREEWFAMRLQRQRDREKKDIKKGAQEDFIREWWGLPEKDQERRKKQLEKMAMGERVGGRSKVDRPSEEDK